MTVLIPSLPPESCTTTSTRSSGTPGLLESRIVVSAASASPARIRNAGTVAAAEISPSPWVMNRRRLKPVAVSLGVLQDWGW